MVYTPPLVKNFTTMVNLRRFSPDGLAVAPLRSGMATVCLDLRPDTERYAMRACRVLSWSSERCVGYSRSGHGGEHEIYQFGIGPRAAADAEGVRVLDYNQFLAGEYCGVVAASAP